MSAMNDLKKLLKEASDLQKNKPKGDVKKEPAAIFAESAIEKTAKSLNRTKDVNENSEAGRWNDPLVNTDFVTQKQMNEHYGLLLQRLQTQMSTIGGGGEVNFSGLDDVNSLTRSEGNFLTYDPTERKYIFDVLPTATQTKLGMIRGAPGVNISSEGILNIDSSGLSFNFGDFITDVQEVTFPNGDVEDVAVLRSQNANEHIVIQSNGEGLIDVIGGLNIFADDTVQNALLSEPIFSVSAGGRLRVFAPDSDSLDGAIEIIGNNDGDFIPANQTGVLIHTTGSSGFLNRTYYDGIENYAVLVGRRYNGTASIPNPVLNGEIIFVVAGQGMTNDGFQLRGPAKISWIATENQSVDNQGGKITIDVTANGTNAFASPLTAAEFTANGIIAALGITGDLTGNADTVTNGVYRVGNQTIAGNKTFSGNTSLGDVGNVSISGGSNNFILQTDGNGSLSWVEKDIITSFEFNESAEQEITVGDFVVINGISQLVTAGNYRIESSLEYEVIPANVADQCAIDLNILINEIVNLPFQQAHVAGFGNGEIITKGTYFIGGAATHTGNIVFDAEGDPDAMFVVICGAALALGISSTSTLVNGAKASNVFWRVSAALTIGATCDIKGTYIGSGAIAPGDVFALEGRLLTTSGAIAMSNATYTTPLGNPSLSINILSTFTMFTPSGALSNTIITGNKGDVCSGLGTISGFSEIRGSVYGENDTNAEGIFEIYKDTIAVTNSSRTEGSKIYSRSKNINLLTNTNIGPTSDTVSVKLSVTIGTFIIKNRNIYIFR